MGLAPILVREIFAVIDEIRQPGTTILLVEQNAHAALQVTSRSGVLGRAASCWPGRPRRWPATRG